VSGSRVTFADGEKSVREEKQHVRGEVMDISPHLHPLFFFPEMKSWPDRSDLVKAFSMKYAIRIYLKALMICIIFNSDQRGIEIHLAKPPGKV